MGKKAKIDKDAMKALREKRSVFVAKAKAAIKNQNRIIKSIKEQIATEGRTVPEIAAGARLPTSQVLMYIAALKTYGEVVEGSKDGSYFKYEMAGKER